MLKIDECQMRLGTATVISVLMYIIDKRLKKHYLHEIKTKNNKQFKWESRDSTFACVKKFVEQKKKEKRKESKL